jgi:hypothetical protein
MKARRIRDGIHWMGAIDWNRVPSTGTGGFSTL